MKLSELTLKQIKDIESKCTKVPCIEATSGPDYYTGIAYMDFAKIFERDYKNLPSPVNDIEVTTDNNERFTIPASIVTKGLIILLYNLIEIMCMKKYSFRKTTEGRWYIILPEWPGDKADLEMVCGADNLLDCFDGGYGIVNLVLSTEKFDCSMKLTLTETDGDSGTYYFSDLNMNIDAWLCHVTKFVFGCIPEIIYFKNY